MKARVYRGFEEFGKSVRRKRTATSPAAEKPLPAKVSPLEDLSDAELFVRSVHDVNALGWSAAPLPPRQPVEIPNPQQSEDEGLRLLTEFVTGKGDIDPVLSGEYVEGASGLEGHLLLDELRSGCFSVQAHLDLHGLTINEAREQVERFIRQSLQRNHGCVRIVHGRGQHSNEGQAVLKEHAQRWLSSRRLGRHVVAFTSARLCDGGGGALYVLLRRRPR